MLLQTFSSIVVSAIIRSYYMSSDVLYLVIELFKALFVQSNSRGEKCVFYNKLFPYFYVCLKGNFYCVCPSDFGHISQNDFWIFPLHVKIKTHKNYLVFLVWLFSIL